jgi:hypothetical protein
VVWSSVWLAESGAAFIYLFKQPAAHAQARSAILHILHGALAVVFLSFARLERSL